MKTPADDINAMRRARGRRRDGEVTQAAARQIVRARASFSRREIWPRDLMSLLAAIPAPDGTHVRHASNVSRVAKTGLINGAWDMFLFDNLPPSVRAALRAHPLDISAHQIMRLALEQGWSPPMAVDRLAAHAAHVRRGGEP